jgi:WD40 repeat protein
VITPDQRHAISASRDRTLKYWSLVNESELFTLYGHTDEVFDVVVTPNGQWAISVSGDQTLKVWNLSTQELVANFDGESPLRSCAIGLDGKTIIVGEHSGRIHFLCLQGL